MYAVDSSTTPQRPSPSGAPPRAAHRGKPPRRRRRDSTPLLLSLPALLVLAALLAYPLYRMITLSFQNMQLRHLFTGAEPPWVGFDNYTGIFTDEVFWDVTRRTTIFTVVSVVLSVIAGLVVALLMRRVANSVRLAMVIVMMFVWAIPQLVSAQIFKWLFDTDFGVVNYLLNKMTFLESLTGIDFANYSWFAEPAMGWIIITAVVVWAGVPFLAITLHAGLTQVPRELIEAATVDGASPWQTLRNIILPILKPLIVIVTTLSVIWNFGLFSQIWVLRDAKPETEYKTLAIYSFTSAFQNGKYSLGSAIAIATVLLMLGAMVFYVRQMFKIGEVD